MTIVACPFGCGGFVNTASHNYCESCRRDLSCTEIVVAEHVPEDDLRGMLTRKASYCWEWFGPDWHRMKCRRSKGHDGNHATHEDGWKLPECSAPSADGR